MKKWRWHSVTAALVITVAIPIYREAKTCEASANKCISSFTASSKSYQAAPPNEAIQACRESQGYFCRILAPANIPNIGLFFAAMLGIGAAIKTLHAIKRQADLQEAAMRQWLILTGWLHGIGRYKEGNGTITISLRLVNPTKFPLNLLSYNFTIEGARDNGSTVRHTLLPDEPFAIEVGTLITAEQLNRRDTDRLILSLTGEISFIDVLECPQKQRVMGRLRCMKGGQTEFIPQRTEFSTSNEQAHP